MLGSKGIFSKFAVFAVIFSAVFSSSGYSQPTAPQFLWEVRTFGGGVQSVPPFQDWTLVEGGWDQTNPANTPTCNRSATFSGGASGGSISLFF